MVSVLSFLVCVYINRKIVSELTELPMAVPKRCPAEG